MGPKVYVGVTDRDWYVHLGRLRNRLESVGERLDELNFWQPGGSRVFRSLREGELFLFKLHSPDNFIVGGGIFASANLLPSTLAWQSFGEKNGAATFDEMQRRILKYRRAGDPRESFTIGCILLQSPFFLDRSRWPTRSTTPRSACPAIPQRCHGRISFSGMPTPAS